MDLSGKKKGNGQEREEENFASVIMNIDVLKRVKH